MLGKPVPDFSLPSTGDSTFTLSSARGKKLVLYFYPKDNTPGCTQQGADFRDAYTEFRRAGAEVKGVSRDSLKSHQGFKAKMRFPFELLSDPEEVAATLTGHSTGKWDGDTLVVETVNIRTDTLLFGQGRSAKGLGHSDKMRIVTRLRLVDAEHLQVKGTVEDPQALVTPWQYTLTYRRHPAEEIVEYLCEDNNQERLDPVTGREITEIPPRRNQPSSPPT